MRPEVPAILGVLRHAAASGRGVLTPSDVEALEEVVKERAALLEACEGTLDILEAGSKRSGGWSGPFADKVRATIAKARGAL